MKNQFLSAVAILACLVGVRARAIVINKCGTYLADGYYTEVGPKHQRVILLDRGTNSQVTFVIRNRNIKKLLPNAGLGVYFKLKLKFTSACWYQCEGDVVEVIRSMSPFEHVKTFLYPRPQPLKGTKVTCQPNPFEKEWH